MQGRAGFATTNRLQDKGIDGDSNMTRVLRAIWNGLGHLRTCIGNLLALVVVVFLLSMLIDGLGGDGTVIQPRTALVFQPVGRIVEQRQRPDPLAPLLGANQIVQSEIVLQDCLLALDRGLNDKRVKALVLRLDQMTGASHSKLEEIAARIRRYREVGKPVYAFGTAYTQSQYFLAAHADHVYLNKHSFNPLGGVQLTGYGVFPFFYKEAIDKLKISFHVFRVGKHKGAVEPYLRNTMSPDEKAATLAWLNILWGHYTRTITAERELDLGVVARLTDEYDQVLQDSDNDPMLMAVNTGLVDEQISAGQFTQKLIDVVGGTDERFNQVNYLDFLYSTRELPDLGGGGRDQIAVITAAGVILPGHQPPGAIGASTLSKLIRDARSNSSVKAIVLRVDSPGGSASASEQIRYELERVQTEGKPVVVSMGSYAASGGYWIAATANKIYAAPTTITGSIGTYIAFPTLDEALAQIGVHTDGVGTSRLAGGTGLTRPLSPIIENVLQRSVQHHYRMFVELVARGKNLSFDEVDKVAQGRVWTGETAASLGLVDALGDLEDAIESAALLSGATDYKVLHLAPQLSPADELLQRLLAPFAAAIAPHLGLSQSPSLFPLVSIARDLGDVALMASNPGTYLHCHYCAVR